MNRLLIGILLAGTISISALMPSVSRAQTRAQIEHRQKTKNDWRNIAYGAGALGLLGLLNHDSTLTFVGVAGALYAANRYEQDRKSQSKLQRARAAYFTRGSFVRDGWLYKRRTVYKNGKKYYQFVKVRRVG